MVLGRHGERGGRYRGELRVDVGGEPLLAHRTLLDGADPALCGPAGTAGARAVGTLVLAGARPLPARRAPEAADEPAACAGRGPSWPGPGGCCWPWGTPRGGDGEAARRGAELGDRAR